MFGDNNVAPPQPGFFDSFKKFVGDIGNTASSLIIGKKQEEQINQPNNGPNGQDGGARSRRRKCNKKHRHTKSCRKYVKKGRKTIKH